jgi:large subunit ribosomal protein L30
LGLRRLNHTVQVEDTPAVRGMINKVYYLVKWEA